MRALIYARGASSTIQYQTKKSIEYCQKYNIEIGGYYSDEGLIPSKPKSKFKDLLKLIDDLKEGDCIVCEDSKTLPYFFEKMNTNTKIMYSGKSYLESKQRQDLLIDAEVERRLQKKLNLLSQRDQNTETQKDFHSKKNKVVARLITAACVRNTYIEELHSKGKVSDKEMRKLMLEVENRIAIALHLLFTEYSIEKLMELNDVTFAVSSYCYNQSQSENLPLDYKVKPKEIDWNNQLRTHLPGNYFHILNDKQELEKLEKYLFTTSGVSWDCPQYGSR